ARLPGARALRIHNDEAPVMRHHADRRPAAGAPRVLVLGIDGATFDLITPFAKLGCLPVLSRLMAEGAHGPLLAWPNMNSAAAWTSMVTGYNPGQHSVYEFGGAVPGTLQDWTPVTGAARRKEAFWSRLSAAGVRVGVINVPISFPADPINGFMLAGMDAPTVRSRGFAHPPELVDELRRRGIDYRIDIPDLGALSKRDPRRGMQLAREMIDARARTIRALLDSHPWEAAMAVFVESDRLQHYYWPREGSALDSPAWKPIRELYVQLDGVLGDLLERVGERCTVLVVSDHGFGPTWGATRCLNPLFARLGLLQFHRGAGPLGGRIAGTCLDWGRRLIPQAWQRQLSMSFPRLHARAVSERNVSAVDWPETVAFASPHGRSVHVAPGGWKLERPCEAAGYEALRERVRSILQNVRDPETNRPLVRAAHRREELYHGPHLEAAPDLIVEWDYDACGDALCYEHGADRIVVRPDRKTGQRVRWRAEHRPEGIFIAHGPGIRKGAQIRCAIYDVAPTILYLQDQPIPSDMDGQVIADIFDPERLAARPVQIVEAGAGDGGPGGPDLSEAERGQIVGRLRDLGYIE
ncbi:MAG: alkaline phosphatase family protein, partial [Candidatus Eisenbacteria bacterium]